MKERKMSILSKLKKNPWILVTLVLAILLAVILVSGFSINFNSPNKVGKNFVDFINSQGTTKIDFVSAKDFGSGLYEVTVLANGQNLSAHVTKDGKYFVQVVAQMESEKQEPVEEETTTTEIQKSDKPKVELFVMTHCPYGTQAEKGFIPTIKFLGDSVDAKIRFVHYTMHGDKEETETLNQVCIREEQSSKYLAYLECFLGNESASSACMKKVGVNEASVQTCIKNGNADKYYKIDSELSKSYGVQGSPTLVINGVQVSSGRSQAAFLDAICKTFNDAPELCSEKLDSANPSPGFGYGTSSGNSAAQCA